LIKENKIFTPKWLRKFISIWFDNEYFPSVKMIQEKNWNALPVADTLNPMEAEWLSNANTNSGISEILGLSFEFDDVPVLDIIDVNRDSILEYNFFNSYKYVFLISSELEFLYFKDQGNRFFLLCGNSIFIKNAYKCSYETAKLMYFDYWIESDFNSQKEKEFLARIWGKYSVCKPTRKPHISD